MKNNGFKFKRKKMIVFSFEGKNNKTESIYFSNCVACDDDYVLKRFSSGVTDPIKMIASTKSKRKTYDYNAKEDRTFIFMDGDNNKSKIKTIKEIEKSLPSDIKIVLCNPCFEIWYLNHFVKTTKSFLNSEELINELKKYIPNYEKNKDYSDVLLEKILVAIDNSKFQIKQSCINPFNNVWELFEKNIIKRRK